MLSIYAGRAATNLQHVRESQENFNYITWMEKRGGEELRTRSGESGREVE
jgi:hypothetical protein